MVKALSSMHSIALYLLARICSCSGAFGCCRAFRKASSASNFAFSTCHALACAANRWLKIPRCRFSSERFGGWVIKFKGMKVTFNAFGEKGKRVQQITVGDAPLELNKTYKICACERDGDPSDMLCRMKNVANAKNTNHTLHSVLKEYLAANSPVTPTPPENADILDAPQTLLTQVTGVDYKFH